VTTFQFRPVRGRPGSDPRTARPDAMMSWGVRGRPLAVGFWCTAALDADGGPAAAGPSAV